MSKGVKKTILEKQISVYNQFLYQNRISDRLGLTRNVPITAEQQIARNLENEIIARAKRVKQKQIDDCLARFPKYSIKDVLTAEDAVYWVNAETAWKREYHQLLQDLKN